jgi:hypothetical protein
VDVLFFFSDHAPTAPQVDDALLLRLVRTLEPNAHGVVVLHILQVGPHTSAEHHQGPS